MKHTWIVLLGLSALLGTSAQTPAPIPAATSAPTSSTSAVNPCLDPTNADYSCELGETGGLILSSCNITDEGVDDIALCLDDLGRENIIGLNLHGNDLTTLPEGIFGNLTALAYLGLYDNDLTTLPEGIFGNLTALADLRLGGNGLTTLPEGIFGNLTALAYLGLSGKHDLTTLPEGIFGDLTALTYLGLNGNDLTTLPEGIFGNLTALTYLGLGGNGLTTLPEGIFGNLTALTDLGLNGNDLTTLPEGIFGNLTALTYLRLDGNALECLPFIPTALEEADGLEVDLYGDECGCSTADVTNVCGEETCTPGEFGYTCGTAPVQEPTPEPTVEIAPASTTPAPSSSASATTTLAPTPDPTPEPTVEEEAPASTTPAPSKEATTLAPVHAPTPGSTVQTEAPASTTPAPSKGPAAITPDSTPIVAGVVSAVAGAALIALGVCLKRRRAAKQKTGQPLVVPPGGDDGNLEQGHEKPQEDVRPRTSAALDVGDRDEKPPAPQDISWPRRHPPAEADAVSAGDIVPPSAAVPLDGAGLADGGDAAVGSTEKSSPTTTSIATASTANMSTAKRDEVAQFHQGQRAADASPVAGGPKQEKTSGGGTGASSTAGRQNSAGDAGLGNAVLAAAQELAHYCQIPGVSEAAAAVCIMANMVTDSRDNVRASESRLRQCRTVVLALKRAAKVAEKGGNTVGEVARILIEEVHEAIFDLVELIKTFRSKNKLSRLFMSTLFKRRQDELDAVVDRAIMRLQLGLQLHVGQDVSAVKDDVSAVKDSLNSAKEDIKDSLKSVKEMHRYQRSISEAALESVAETRSIKRRRKLDQIEIPKEHLSMTDELLGKGGSGEVYLADYNGHNAAVKVLYIAHDVGPLDENRRRRETSQRRAFLRELEAMIRLRSDNTVNVYGAVASLPDRMMLVMELLSGGDLLTLLRESSEPFTEEQSRRIIRDICTGMAFLHSKKTVHGDLKSANVLLDGGGRAKIADFGTSRWTQHTNSTGLATYTTKSSQTTKMSVAWSAPEVLDSEGSSYASDVYSFGIVVWEVTSRKLPWSNKTRVSELVLAVLKGIRPSFHVDTPVDIVDIAKACWCGEPKERTTFRAILEGVKAKGWVMNDE
ncbi:unnamed protein product [Pylaiella littoralis]